MSEPTSDSTPADASSPTPSAAVRRPARRRYVPAVGPRLQRLLSVVFGLFALLAVNSTYLLGVHLLEAIRGQTYQNWFYMVMFLAHLVLGLLIVLPVVLFGLFHARNAYKRPNRRAVYVGFALYGVALLLLASGIVLTRIEGVIVVKDQAVRGVAYWVHVLSPLVAGWLFVLHRLAGKRIQWRVGLRWAAVAGVFGVIMVALQAQDPRGWNVEGPKSGEKYFFPSLARTATGDFIPEQVLMDDQYCAQCHEDSHETWAVSAHRFSSFNNPAYKFSVEETREYSKAIYDGEMTAARWCAGCHDPVVFFAGKFDDPDFDMEKDPTGQAGITCTSCHGITNINSVRGNSDYTIEEPVHYPFAFSDSASLRWVNQQLIKAKPEFHKKTFLKPLHKTPEFCGSCHKVHLPPELNQYKWLRGQNHYDAYHLSGVSGHGITSFYYPPKAEPNCNGCHMPLAPSEQFAAADFDDSGTRQAHDHQFPSANTALAALLDLPDWVNERHRAFNEGVMRLDLFGLREDGTVDGELIAPLRPDVPTLEPGRRYLVETVVRTVKMGHIFTQGTADSNEVWLAVRATTGGGEANGSAPGRVVGASGGMDEEGYVDPWSHFVNVYMLDRKGERIDRRNAQDIFTPLYNHQIPPGAADVIHYVLEVPDDAGPTLTVEVELLYRKFDTTYMKKVMGEDYVNDLPVMVLARDQITFPVGVAAATGTGVATVANAPSSIPEWQRWNDYGIGLLLKGGKSKGQLRQAEEAFRRVEELGQYHGPLNLARVYLEQGTVQDQAIAALERAATYEEAPVWSVLWFTGLVNKQNGFLDEAIDNFTAVVELDSAETRERGFDFSQDYRLLTELGQTLFERSKQERGDARRERREEYMRRAESMFRRALELDPENLSAHYNLDLIYKQLGDRDRAAEHFAFYRRYKPDDNARDRVITEHRRRNPAADHAAEAIVLYDLGRDEAFPVRFFADPAASRPVDLAPLEPSPAAPPAPDPSRVAAGAGAGGTDDAAPTTPASLVATGAAGGSR